MKTSKCNHCYHWEPDPECQARLLSRKSVQICCKCGHIDRDPKILVL